MNSLFRKLAHASTVLFALSLMAVIPLVAHAADVADSKPATVPGLLPAFITAGNIDPNHKVPTINGVPGAGVSNLDVAFPVTVLAQGTQYVYSIAVQDYNFTGSSTVSYKLTQVQNGKKVTLDSQTITTFKTAPGNVWVWVATGNPIPNSPGPATLTGIFKYGSVTTSVNANVVLQ
jgi:hypothetical protein